MQSWFSQIVIGIIVTVVGTVIANSIVGGRGGRHFIPGIHLSGATLSIPLCAAELHPNRKRKAAGRPSFLSCLGGGSGVGLVTNQLSSCQTPVGSRQATISVRFVVLRPLKTTTA